VAEESKDPTYREMVRQAKLVQADGARKRRDKLIRQLRTEGWTLRDIARGAGISHNAVAKICGQSTEPTGRVR
jgi:lambda repressor-like predicted transcriptional regulator